MEHHKLYLGGEWRDSDEHLPVVDPATAEPFATVAQVGPREAAFAIEAAERAFAPWAALPAKTRADYLLAVAAELEQRTDAIARLITQENGKPLAQSRAEVALSVDHLRWFAEEVRRAYGRIVPPQVEGKRHLVLSSPVGVVGAISPWNFPLVLPVRKIAPALAAGCPVVLKPSEKAPLSALAFAECVHAANLPPGVFSVLVGEPGAIGDVFLSHPACRKITFTGSTAVGKKLIRASADHVKRLSLELGGQAPVLVFADADLDIAVRETLRAKFRNTGQACIAANRIYIERPVYQAFRERFVAATQKMKVGNGLDEDVEIGPLIDEAGMEKALTHIQNALNAGGRVLCGGKRVARTGGTSRLFHRAHRFGRRARERAVYDRGNVCTGRAPGRLRH